MKEALAAYAHNLWTKWMTWVFEVSTENEDGSVTIPLDKVLRWKRQMDTPYTLLSEEEKESDRKQVGGIISIFKAYYDLTTMTRRNQ